MSAHEHTMSHCKEKTITKTVTITKRESKQHGKLKSLRKRGAELTLLESSQSLIMISQLSDGESSQSHSPPCITDLQEGQISGATVPVTSMISTVSHMPMEPSSLSIHHGPPIISPSPSAIVNPLQSLPSHGMPRLSMGMPPHGYGTGSTTCNESMSYHDGTETRNSDAPVQFPIQHIHNVTSIMGHSHATKPVHKPTLSDWYSQTRAAAT